MRCEPSAPVSSLAHVELYADDHVVLVPAGIGVAPPARREGAYVRGGRCMYPLHTLEPTGLVLLAPGPARTLGELFDVWGQPLGRHSLAGFRSTRRGQVSVFIDGVLWRGDPAAAPLNPGSQLTIELGRAVPPHRRYEFPALTLAAR